MLMMVHIQPDKRFHRAHLKPGHRRKGRSRLKVVVRMVVLTVVAFGCAFWTFEMVGRTSFLSIETITVIGNNRLSAGEVVTLVEPLHGHNLFFVDLDEVRHDLRAVGWVDDVTLRRILPSTIEIMVTERTPVGLGRFGSALFLIDAEGSIIDEFGPRFSDLDLPIIDCLSVDHEDSDRDLDKRRAALVTQLLSDIGQHSPRFSKQLSQVDVADPHDAVVLLTGDPVFIHLGEEQFAERLQTYEDLKQSLDARVPDVDYVDLRFDGRIYVQPLNRD